jgi:hypothetical protein
MKSKLLTRTLAISVGMIATIALFNNCSQDLPSQAKSFSSSEETGSETPESTIPPGVGTGPVVLTALNLTLNPSTIFTDQSAQAVITGGQPPYSYSIISGMARIDSTGAITGPFVAGSVVVKISDQANQSEQVVLTVNARPPVTPPPPPPPGTPTYLSCPTPFGPSIPHGATLTAFREATIFCPSTAQCASEVRVCNNGRLSGSYTASSCGMRACVYKATEYATDQYSGNTLCQISTNDNGSYSSLPQVASGSQLPTSCMNNEYNRSQYCEVQMTQNGGGDGGSTSYSYTKYTCRGANENIMPQLFQNQNNGGGSSN